MHHGPIITPYHGHGKQRHRAVPGKNVRKNVYTIYWRVKKMNTWKITD
tara:strand:+ start:5231 stop:5374 length:144 start_codon:yes stop_codon:yes gene_type:complete